MSDLLPASLQHPRPRREDFQRASNYAVASLSESLRGPLRWTCRRMAHGVAPNSPHQWRNGVILGPSHIGDVLYNTPALPALRAGLPECRWTYVASGASVQVLQDNPYLDEVIPVEESGGFRAWLERSRQILAHYRFDAAIAYAGGSSWRDLALAVSLGIPNRVGYVHKGFSGLTTHPASIRLYQPFPAYFRDLVCQLIGQPPESIPSLRPLVYPQPAHEEAVDRASARLGLDWRKQPVLACSVTSRQPSGIWPQEQFLKTIRQVREQVPCTVVYLGAQADGAQLRLLAEATGPDAFVIAGELNLPAVVALMRRCRAALTTDSGPRHLANAAGVPVFFVRNLSFRQAEAGAYCSTDHDMAPTELQLLTPEEQAAAFAAIDPAAVAKQILQVWRAAD